MKNKIFGLSFADRYGYKIRVMTMWALIISSQVFFAFVELATVNLQRSQRQQQQPTPTCKVLKQKINSKAKIEN